MKIKKLYEDSKLPTRGSEQAAGWDLYCYGDAAAGPILIYPGQVAKIKTGIAVALEQGTAALILPRSGLATKRGLRPANTPGLIDSDYRGEVIVALRNDSNFPQTIEVGDRIAQMMVIPYFTGMFDLVNELDETERADGGFGSTGNN